MNDPTAETLPVEIDIPPCPAVLGEITHLWQQENPDFRQLAILIQQDPALAAAVLRAAFRLSGKRNSTSILQAIQLLGLARLQQIALHVLLHAEFGIPAGVRATLWDELRLAAQWSERLARRFRKVPTATAYTVGLLHDVGIFLMARKFPNYEATTSLARGNPSESYTLIEQRRHQVDHATLGYYLARRWGLAEPIPMVIAAHHEYELLLDSPDERAHLIAYLVIADRIAGELVGVGADHEYGKARDGIAELLNYDPEDLDAFVEMEIDIAADELAKHR
ncbi:MAG: HDOD domain-containing protein [Hydrogenophilus sp.]|nr:HDOD domain-containing protein [Hydrogenophilus sp.]